MFNHILVLVHHEKDNSDAIARALMFAGPDTDITLLSLVYNRSLDVEYLFDKAGRDAAQQAFCQQHSKHLSHLLDDFKQKGLHCQLEVQWSKHKHLDLIAYLQGSHTDFIIKTQREHNLLQRAFFSHNEWHLVRMSPVPVLLCKPGITYPAQPVITAAIDPCHGQDKPASLDHKLAKTAMKLAASFHGSAHFFHSYDPVPPSLLTDVDSMGYEDLSNSIREHHQGAYRQFLSHYNMPAGQTHLLEGDIYITLPEFISQQHSPLTVMGAISRSQLDQWLIGSTAERLLEVLPCDLLILKPDQAV
ncbi:MAG: universal stress protein [Oceanospirillaceae bacterium]|nr:universal stress protein [Oceanospirillaceae bacterium]MCP5334485.1 universal stress protein [Oceanospirillaceae bacterium]MCP5350811.1 universal stress protein [Oceanospirillaceae bacterium]